MSKYIYILQNRHETNTPNNIIKKIYDMIIHQEAHDGSVYDNESDFIGEVTLSNPTYKEWVDKIHEVFPDLIVNSQYYMLFKDSNVEQIMINYLLSKGVGDGVGITYDDAKDRLITSLPSFKSNASIEYFNELPNFEKVTKITNQQFYECTNLKEIDLSNITLFDGTYNFSNCSNLQKIILGNVTVISQSCFEQCSTLEFVENMDNVTEIKPFAFYRCSYLETIDLSHVLTIGHNAFRECTSLTNIDISSVTFVSDNAFRSNTNLTLQNNILPNLTTIGNDVFRETAITGIDLENCLSIGSSAFYACKSMTSLNLPNCQTINNDAFNGCSALAINVNLPNLTTLSGGVFRSSGILSIVNIGNVTQIGGTTFKECKSLTTITNNALYNVTSIGNEAFSSCSLLQSVGSMPYLTSIGNAAFSGCKLLNEFEFSTTITSIGNNAFNVCESLVINDLNLPNLTLLGSSTFRSTKLKNVISLGSITSISTNTFYDCTELTTFASNAIPNVTYIGNSAFRNCKMLSDINLTSCTEIDIYAFYVCINLNLENYNLTNITNIKDYAFNGCTSLTQIKIPNCISVGSGVFNECSLLTTVDLSNCVSVGASTFRSCTVLTTITGLENIVYHTTDHETFYNCNSLVFPETITINSPYVGSRCFFGCKKMKKVILGSNVNTLYTDAFKGCNEITKIEGLDHITSIGVCVFSGCTNLEGIIDLSNLTTQPSGNINGISQSGYTALFAKCSKITKIIIGHIDKIGGVYGDGSQSPFADCTNLHTVEINSLNTFYISEWRTFYNCPNFKNLVIRASSVPTVELSPRTTLDSITWDRMSTNANANIYVPDNLVNAYKATDGFNKFSDHILPISQYIPITN